MLERILTPRQPNLSLLTNFLLLQYSDTADDAINATPLIAALHAAIPEARVSAAAHGPALNILAHNPGLEQLIPTRSPAHNLTATIRALRSARPFGREHYATLLTLGNETTHTLFAAMLGNSPTRIGFTDAPELVTVLLRYDDRISPIANNLSIIAALGHSAALLEALRSNTTLIEPQLYPTA